MRNNFDSLAEMFFGNVNVPMISEQSLITVFLKAQFYYEAIPALYSIGRNLKALKKLSMIYIIKTLEKDSTLCFNGFKTTNSKATGSVVVLLVETIRFQ